MAAKLKKLPKKPKASASYEAWQNWERRCKEVQASNRKLIADKKKKEAIQKKRFTKI